MKLAEKLLRLSRPHFGQPVTWLLLCFALVLAVVPFEYAQGERIGPATILSWLPGEVLSAPWLYQVIRWTLIVSAVLWAAQLLIPWSCWATALSFMCLWALRMENSTGAAHTFNVTNMLLVIHAMWYHFYRREICDALRDGRFWSTPLYPRWAFMLGVFYLGLFHTLAGLTKIMHSGLDWGDGLSLQLWVSFEGWPASPFGRLILSNRTIAMLVQSAALFFETTAIMALFSPRLRLIAGIGLLGFYAGVLTTFVDYGFHFNAILVALYFLPAEQLGQRLSAWGNQRFRRRVIEPARGMFGYLRRAIAVRLDFFQTLDVHDRAADP